MANGFFLGGIADGMKTAADLGLKNDEIGLKKDTLAADIALRSRGLDIQSQQLSQADQHFRQELGIKQRAVAVQEQSQKFAETRKLMEDADKSVSDTMTVVSETIKQGLAAGKDPSIIAKAVQPLVESAKSIAGKVGRNPSNIDATVNALFARPNGIDVASAAGKAEATKKIESAKTIAAATGQGVDIDPYANPKDKVQLENSLRDDYVKMSDNFIKIRDAKNRIDTIEKTGAGDVALVFQYMKILDPGSTVREGEFATASNAAGVPASIIAQYNKIVGGGVLSDTARTEIKSQANRLYQSQASQHQRMTNQFKEIAKRQKLDPKNVVVDMSPNSSTDVQSTPSGLKFRIVK